MLDEVIGGGEVLILDLDHGREEDALFVPRVHLEDLAHVLEGGFDVALGELALGQEEVRC